MTHTYYYNASSDNETSGKVGLELDNLLKFLLLKDFQRKNLGFFIFTIVMSFVIMIALMCYKDVARKVPTNYGNFSIF